MCNPEMLLLGVTATLVLLHLVHSQRDYLFFSSAGSLSPMTHPGVYGGPIRYRQGGNASEVFTHGLTCVQYEDTNFIQRELHVKAITFDIKTADMLLYLGEASNSKNITILRAPVCAANHGCPNNHVQVVINEISTKPTVAAFAAYAGQVYILTERILKVTPREKQKQIEIRWINGCQSGQTFSINRCTELIAVVIKDTYESESKYHTTSGLAVIPSEYSGKKVLTFFVQLQNTISKEKLEDVEPEAFVIFRVTSEGRVTREHEEFVNPAMRTYVVQGVGQITYRQGFMCWTALDRVVCGEVDKQGRLSNPRTILEKRHVKMVCQATPGEDLIASITTGVAIAKVPRNIRDEVVLYFGCVASARGLGGSGMVRKSGRIPAQIFPLRHSGSPVLAGSMFMTTPSMGCDRKYIGPSNVISAGTRLFEGYFHGTAVMMVLNLYLLCSQSL